MHIPNNFLKLLKKNNYMEKDMLHTAEQDEGENRFLRQITEVRRIFWKVLRKKTQLKNL
jgi:hypothetical protein